MRLKPRKVCIVTERQSIILLGATNKRRLQVQERGRGQEEADVHIWFKIYAFHFKFN